LVVNYQNQLSESQRDGVGKNIAKFVLLEKTWGSIHIGTIIFDNLITLLKKTLFYLAGQKGIAADLADYGQSIYRSHCKELEMSEQHKRNPFALFVLRVLIIIAGLAASQIGSIPLMLVCVHCHCVLRRYCRAAPAAGFLLG